MLCTSPLSKKHSLRSPCLHFSRNLFWQHKYCLKKKLFKNELSVVHYKACKSSCVCLSLVLYLTNGSVLFGSPIWQVNSFFITSTALGLICRRALGWELSWQSSLVKNLSICYSSKYSFNVQCVEFIPIKFEWIVIPILEWWWWWWWWCLFFLSFLLVYALSRRWVEKKQQNKERQDDLY